MHVGRSRQLVVMAVDRDGNAVPEATISWRSRNPSIVSVEAGGVARAWSEGIVTLVAAVARVEAEIRVVVRPLLLAGIELSPEAAVVVGESVVLPATLMGSDRRPVLGKPIEWRSEDPAVAAVDQSGRVTAHRAGQVSITASHLDLTSTCVVTVLEGPPYLARLYVEPSVQMLEGERLSFVAKTFDQFDALLPDVSLSFSSDDPNVATIVDGLLYARAPGQTTITTRALELEAATRVDVRPAPRPGEIVLQADGDLVLGETRDVKATVRSTEGELLDHWPVTWASSDPGVVAVSDGWLTAVGEGRATISAAADGVVTELSLRVDVLRFQQVVTSFNFACGLAQDGQIFCWGRSPHSPGRSRVAPNLIPTALRFRQIAAGHGHLCGIVSPGDEAYCLGLGSSGQLGNGDILTTSTFVEVQGGRRFRQIEAGGNMSCGIEPGGAAFCWGAGALGAGESVERSSVPIPIAGDLEFQEIRISNGLIFSAVEGGVVCGITTSQRGYCWGLNGSGELGNGSQAFAPTPSLLEGSLRLSSIAVEAFLVNLWDLGASSYGHGCGIDESNQAFCWGANAAGQLGDGSLTDSLVPVPVGGPHRFRDIALTSGPSAALSCGISTSDRLLCWGSHPSIFRDVHGPLTSSLPFLLSSTETFSSVEVSSAYACALSTAGLIHCWGNAPSAPLGLVGGSGFVITPTPILGQLPPP